MKLSLQAQVWAGRLGQGGDTISATPTRPSQDLKPRNDLVRKKKKKGFSLNLIWSNKIVLQRAEKASPARAGYRQLLKMLCLLTGL